MQTEHQTFTQERGFGPPLSPPPTSVGSFGQQGRGPTPHIETSVGFTSIQSFATVRVSKVFGVSTESFFGQPPPVRIRKVEDPPSSPHTEFRTGLRQPLEIITLAAGEFITQHALASTIETVLNAIAGAYSHVERVTVDMTEDPEVQGYRWLGVTIRLRGDVSAILDSERRFRHWLRKAIVPRDYRQLVLSYEIPA